MTEISAVPAYYPRYDISRTEHGLDDGNLGRRSRYDISRTEHGLDGGNLGRRSRYDISRTPPRRVRSLDLGKARELGGMGR